MGKRRVLVADDECLLAHTLARALAKQGLEVTTVASAEEALDQVRGSFYDLCFLDWRFPGLDGLQALPVIKEISPTTRVVFMTASETTPAERDAIDRYADFFLRKPFNMDEVRTLAPRLLGGGSGLGS